MTDVANEKPRLALKAGRWCCEGGGEEFCADTPAMAYWGWVMLRYITPNIERVLFATRWP